MSVLSAFKPSNGTQRSLNGRTEAPVVLHTRVVTGTGGGPDKTILNSPRFLESFGFRALCAYMYHPNDPGFATLAQKAEKCQAALLAVPDRGPWDVNIISHFLNICRREKVAIWHAHDYKSNLLGLVVRRFWPMQLVTTVHGWVKHTSRTPLYYRIDRWCLPYYDKVICVSEDLHQLCLEARVRPDRCIVIHNAIDTTDFSRQRSPEQAKKNQGIPSQRIVIGAVGRLSEEKGFDKLIEATDKLLNAGLDLQLIIIGEGEEQSRLQLLIESLNRCDRMQLLGYRSDIRPIYEMMDIFALSSLREGLPNVVLEAMSMQVPVVATRIAGVPRLIADGETGLLVEPGSVSELAVALQRLVSNADLRRTLGQAGRQCIEQKYSFAERMQKVRAIYDDVLRRNGKAGIAVR